MAAIGPDKSTSKRVRATLRHLTASGTTQEGIRAVEELVDTPIDVSLATPGPTQAIVLTLDDTRKTTLRMHPLWLRERCGKFQESTGQRLFDVSDCIGALSTEPQLQDDGRLLRLQFADGAEGVWPVSELCASMGLHEKQDHLANLELPLVVPWSSIPLSTLRQFDAAGPEPEHVFLGEIARQLLEKGAVVVRNVPTENAEVCRFAGKFGVVRTTEWGRHFDVKTVQDRDDGALAEDLAYTNEAIDLHFDNVYREPVPGYWCLHCLETGPGGDNSGETLISDGFFAAEVLRREDPDAFAVLTHVKVAFKYISDGVALVRRVPHIALADDGVTICQLTYSGRLDAVDGAQYSFETLDSYYRARARWLVIARENAVVFQLLRGDMVILDNKRVMHGRTAIDPKEHIVGVPPRHMQGCYIDRDGVESKYRLRQLGAPNFVGVQRAVHAATV